MIVKISLAHAHCQKLAVLNSLSKDYPEAEKF